MNHYRLDIFDKERKVAADVDVVCDMWDLPEEVLVTKLMVASHEMGLPENRTKYDFRLPAQTYRATVKQVVECTRVITTKA